MKSDLENRLEVAIEELGRAKLRVEVIRSGYPLSIGIPIDYYDKIIERDGWKKNSENLLYFEDGNLRLNYYNGWVCWCRKRDRYISKDGEWALTGTSFDLYEEVKVALLKAQLAEESR